jgi:hypothetical protein
MVFEIDSDDLAPSGSIGLCQTCFDGLRVSDCSTKSYKLRLLPETITFCKPRT